MTEFWNKPESQETCSQAKSQIQPYTILEPHSEAKLLGNRHSSMDYIKNYREHQK